MVVEEEVVVVEALEGAAGLPAVAFSRLHVEQHLVPDVPLLILAPVVRIPDHFGA